MNLLTVAGRRRRRGPRTGYETHGDLTTFEEEGLFWDRIAAETALTVDVPQTSALGRPIRVVSIGADAPGRTVLIVCSRHGREKATREGALALMRNLAYATDSATLDYLANNRIALMPAYNVDSVVDEDEGIKGVPDLQGDVWYMYVPEPKAWAWAWDALKPSVHVDAHCFGYRTDPPTGALFGSWRGFSLENANADIKSLTATNGPADVMYEAVVDAGYAAESFSTNLRLSSSGIGAINHAVSLTTELATAHPRDDQYHGFLAALEALVGWHAANGDAVESAWTASRSEPSAPEFVPSYWAIDGTLKTVPGLLGYTIPAALNEWHRLLFGIQEPVGNFVTVQQPAGRAVVQLLDADSPYRQFGGTSVRVMA